MSDATWKEWGAVSLNPANPSTLNWAVGCFSDTIPTRNGAGDYSFTFPTEWSIDSAEIDVHCQQLEAAAASGLTSYGFVNTSDVSKRLTILREAALGATSALTDITGPVIIRVYKRVPKT